MDRLAIRDEVLPGATKTALVIPEEVGQNEWEALGEKLGQISRASCWWIGDWINYGEDSGYISSEKYDRAVELTGLKRQTLRIYALVCRRWSIVDRNQRLSFSAHRLALEAAEVSPDALPAFKIITERHRQIAAANAKRVYDGLSTMQGYCSALEQIKPERAIAGASNGDIAAWDSMAGEAIAALARFRRAIRKGAVNG